MRISAAPVTAAALTVALIGVIAAALLLYPARPVLVSAGFEEAAITPNTDGEDDLTTFHFELGEPAFISLTLTNTDGESYVVRRDARTPAGAYSILFSGVVDGFSLPDEDFDIEIQRRLIPNGEYTWQFDVRAVDGDEQGDASGTLIVSDGDAELPLLTGFTVSPVVFTPNQDGIADRVAINAYLTKEATVSGFLVGLDGERVHMSPRETETRSGEVGWQEFDYEGGVDIGADPPPNGEYEVVIEAQDAVGQRVAQRGRLTIRDGGKPRATILPQGTGADVVFTTMPYDDAYFSRDRDTLGEPIPVPNNPDDYRLGQVVVQAGDMLVFMVVIENYGNSSIRTVGPPPGTVYQQEQLAAALGPIGQDGVWRVGIQCEANEESYPYRWAVGALDQLEQVEDLATGNVYYYLLPGERSVVWGAVRLTRATRTRNPQQCWAGLIHEGVAVANHRIGARDILIEGAERE